MASSPIMPPDRHVEFKKGGWGAAILTTAAAIGVFLTAFYIHTQTYRQPTDLMMRTFPRQAPSHGTEGATHAAPAHSETAAACDCPCERSGRRSRRPLSRRPAGVAGPHEQAAGPHETATGRLPLAVSRASVPDVVRIPCGTLADVRIVLPRTRRTAPPGTRSATRRRPCRLTPRETAPCRRTRSCS